MLNLKYLTITIPAYVEMTFDKKALENMLDTRENDQRPYREYVYSVAIYQKYLTRLGELIIFEPWRENYHFSQPC